MEAAGATAVNIVPKRRYTFGRADRVKRQGDFIAITRTGERVSRGPLLVQALRGGPSGSRLGIRIGRRVGNAVQRNLIKRRLREAYRLIRNDLPMSIDVIITVRPHEALILADYQRLVSHALVRLTQKLRATESPTGEPS